MELYGSILGVPIPNKIKTALEQLNNDEDQENGSRD